ncbi:MAG TPA: MoaD/ThiS family protein [Gemmatimonadales bacterium]|jgi:molybdopterin converting factor small subunit|nr:MoaD/ThiS family protein [Gemmatimonadales bacterium]
MTVSAASTVTVRVLLFASYAEAAGQTSLTLTLPAPATVASAIRALRAQSARARLPERPLCAVNLAHARLDTPISTGDEIAILPPLAGG